MEKEKEYYEETVYTCRFCNKIFALKEHIEEHLDNCILNPLRFFGSTTDKNTIIRIKAPTEEDNGYKDYRLLDFLGKKNELVVETKEGYRVLDEKEILTELKDGYSPLEVGGTLKTIRSEAWQKQVELVERSIIEQKEIDESIQEFWEDIKDEVQEMKDSGLNGQDIEKELKEKYNLKE